MKIALLPRGRLGSTLIGLCVLYTAASLYFGQTRPIDGDEGYYASAAGLVAGNEGKTNTASGQERRSGRVAFFAAAGPLGMPDELPGCSSPTRTMLNITYRTSRTFWTFWTGSCLPVIIRTK